MADANEGRPRGIWPTGEGPETSLGDGDRVTIAAQADREMIRERVEWLYRDIAQVDLVIHGIAALLRVSQPLVSGRLDIRWWKVSGNEGERYPVLVKWVKARTGRVSAQRVKRFNGVAQLAAFDLNRAETQTAVELFLTYVARRKALRQKIWKLKNLTAKMGGVSMQIGNDREYVKLLYRRVGRRLVEAGYTIDAVTAKAMGLTADPSD